MTSLALKTGNVIIVVTTDLRLWISKTTVELEDFWSIVSQHQPSIQHTYHTHTHVTHARSMHTSQVITDVASGPQGGTDLRFYGLSCHTPAKAARPWTSVSLTRNKVLPNDELKQVRK